MFDEAPIWIKLGLLAFAGFVVWEFLRPKWPMRVVVDRHGVRWQKGIPKSKERELNRFFQHDISIDRRVTIQAKRDRQGGLQVQCRGRIDPGTRQQIRNFLLTIL